MFNTPEYVFVTNMDGPVDALVWFHNQRAGAENLIKEANNDAGLAAHSSNILDDERELVPDRHAGLQPELLAAIVQPGGGRPRGDHAAVTLATARLQLLFLAAKIWRYAGRVGVSYSDHYQKKGILHRLMERLRNVTGGANGFVRVVPTRLRS